MQRQADVTAIVLAGGDPVDERLRASLPEAATVIAADSGLDQAERLGLHVDVVVGDFDSVDPQQLEAAERAGATIERHPAEKDFTDLELALRVARRRGATRVVVVGGWGGRIDHALANLLLLGASEFATLNVEAVGAGGRVVAVHDHVDLGGRQGDLVTLLAVGQPARGVRTEGLRYPLHGETLHPGSTRGVSNEMLGSRSRVEVEQGVLLAIVPTMEVA